MRGTKTLRLYEHDETRARVEGSNVEVEAHGWSYNVGDVVEIDGENHVIISVSRSILTDDARGNYVTAEVRAMREATTREVLVLDAGENEWGRYPTLAQAKAFQDTLRIYTTIVCTRCASEGASDPNHVCTECEAEVSNAS